MKFYQEIVGLKVDRRFTAGPNIEIAFLGDGETKIELVCDKSEIKVSISKDISWGFEVNSIDEMMKKVKEEGIIIEGGPIQPNPHVKFFYILDPNGLKIQFVENMMD